MSASDAKPLPFIYQFAAGAVAGVSEVRFLPGTFQISESQSNSYLLIDLNYVSFLSTAEHLFLSLTACRYPLDVVKTRV